MEELDFVKEILFDEDDVDNAIKRIAESCEIYHQNEETIILTVLNGGKFLSDHLFENYLNDKYLKKIYVEASSYFKNRKVLEINIKTYIPDIIDFKDKKVIILDDIYDTGETLRSLCEEVMGRGAKKVSCAVLVKRDEWRRQFKVPIFSYGFKLKNNDFLVGCGMDYNGNYRDLPYIASVKNI